MVEGIGYSPESTPREPFSSNREIFEKLFQAREDGNDELVAKLRDEIIESNRPLALMLAKRFADGGNKRLELGDWQSEAYLGLIDAVDHYSKPEYQFSTYAYPCIMNRLIGAYNRSQTEAGFSREYFSEFNKAHTNDEIDNQFLINYYSQKRQGAINKIRRRALESDYKPTEEEIQDEIAKILNKQLQIYYAVKSGAISLDDKKRFYSSEDADNLEIDRQIADDDPEVDPQKVVERIFLADALRRTLEELPDRLGMVLAMRFGLLDFSDQAVQRLGDDEISTKYAIWRDKIEKKGEHTDNYSTHEEVGNVFGITKSRVGQLEAEALRKLYSRYNQRGSIIKRNSFGGYYRDIIDNN